MQDDVLGIHAGRQASVHIDAADLRLADGHRLCRKHVAHLAGSYSESDCAEGAVRGGVRVAAGDGGSRLGDPELGTDNVDDALPAARKIEKCDTEFFAVPPQRLDHFVGELVGERLFALVGRNDVIDRGEGALWIKNLESEIAQHAESLWAGDFVNKVGANEQLRGAV